MASLPLFWAIALALVLATLAALLWPLLRGRATRGPAGDDASAAIFRDQKRQIDAEFASGAIDAAERDLAQAELVERLARELDAAGDAPAARGSRAAWIVALALVAIVPAATLAGYLALGQPDAIGATAARTRASDADVVAMIERLAQRMREQPDDPKGWVLLGRSYAALQRFDDSAKAYEQAALRQPNDADLLADWADALGMAQGRTLAGRPAELVRQALAADPQHPKALALAASAAMEARDDRAAIGYWKRLLALVPPGSEDARGIEATIAQLEGSSRPSASTPASAPAPAPPAAAGARIAGRVIVAPALAGRVPPEATVFVFARAAEGPRIPLAVLRKTVRDLPFEFVLDDSMAMAPGMNLSSAPRVVVEVRVSASGRADPASGDLTGRSEPVAPGASGIAVTIDRVQP